MRFIAVLFICLFPSVAFTQPTSLLHKSHAEKFRYIDSLYEQYDRNPPAYLTGWEKWAMDNNDPELACQLRIGSYAQAIGSNPGQVSIEKLEKFRKEAKDYPLVEIEITILFGDYYLRVMHKNSWALESYLQAYNDYQNLPPDKFPGKRKYIYLLAGTYFRYGDYVHSIIYHKEALATKGLHDDELVNTICNSIGIGYKRLYKYDSSELYLMQLYNESVKKNDSIWIGIAGENIGMTYFGEKKYRDAITFLSRDTGRGTYISKNQNNVATSLLALAEIYYDENDLSEAEKFLDRVKSLSQSGLFGNEYRFKKDLYRLLFKVYTAKNDMHLANIYADSAMTAGDSAAAKEISFNQTTAAERADFIKHKFEAAGLEQEKYIQNTVRNSLIVILILISLIAIMFISRQRLKQHKLEAEKKNAETELNTAELQLDGFKNSVQEKNILIENFNNELERMRKGEQKQADNELISELLQSIILTDEQWERFRVLFEKVHKGFFAALKNKMPDLTQSEIRFLALTKLKMTSKEMAAMLGISTITVRTHRHRLRKKFDMDKDGLMEGLLDDI